MLTKHTISQPNGRDNSTEYHAGRAEAARRRQQLLMRFVIGSFLAVYSLVTIVPFYFLFIRAFVPTRQSTELHLWIPQADSITMEAQLGTISTYYSVDMADFKEKLGIDTYVNPRYTLREISEEYGIPQAEIEDYFGNYVRYNGMFALFKGEFLKHLLITVGVVAISLVLGGLLGLATGSVLGGFRRRWHLWVYYLYLLQIAISPMMIILPVYLIMTRYLGLYDSYLSLILLFIKGGALSTMVFTAFVATIPSELRESVEIDGGNHWHYYFYLLLPLARTPFAVYTAVSLPLFWNDLLYGFLFLSPEKTTLMPFINAFSGTFATNLQAVYSGLLMATLPLLAIYIVFRKMFMRSALAGAIKG